MVSTDTQYTVIMAHMQEAERILDETIAYEVEDLIAKAATHALIARTLNEIWSK